MIEDTAVFGTTANGSLALTKDRDVDEHQFESFCTAVHRNAEDICKGIVGELKKQKIQARVVHAKQGQWVVEVGGGTGLSRIEPGAVTANITFTGAGADVPAIINALGGFFGNWHAVAGLIALGAAYVAGQYVLNVRRAP